MDGIQRLSEMIKGQKDKYLIKIVEYLILQTQMNQYYLKEEKNLKEMAEYIKKLAKKQATNGVAVVEDDVVYQWAMEYFIKTNKELGIEKNTVQKVTKIENKKINDEFGSIFDSDEKEISEVKKEEIEQISLF